MKITEIKPQKRISTRVSLFVDGRYRFSLDRGTLQRAGLHVGDVIEEGLIEELELRDQFPRARDYGYLLLSHRDRTEREMRERLERKGFAAETVREVLDFFKRNGLVDDGRFARAWVSDALRNRPMGRMRLLHELRRRRVGDRDAELAVEEAFSADAVRALELEGELARRAADKKIKSLSSVAPETARERLYRHLRNRGFHFAVIHDVVEERFSGNLR
jgi:regulatory protein